MRSFLQRIGHDLHSDTLLHHIRRQGDTPLTDPQGDTGSVRVPRMHHLFYTELIPSAQKASLAISFFSSGPCSILCYSDCQRFSKICGRRWMEPWTLRQAQDWQVPINMHCLPRKSGRCSRAQAGQGLFSTVQIGSLCQSNIFPVSSEGIPMNCTGTFGYFLKSPSSFAPR
jgi:hypothetical protein